MRPRIALVHPRLIPYGGGQTVAAWTLQALRDVGDVTLVTWDRPDFDGVNRLFGTSLRPGDAHVVRPALARAGLRPARANLLTTACLIRLLRRLDAGRPFGAIIGTHDEMDFGRPGIQYVHYPHEHRWPSSDQLRGSQRLPGAVQAYRGLCRWIAPMSREGTSRNVTVVNSRFVADVFTRAYRSVPLVVHPPVPGGFPDVAWEDREDGIACLGRLAPVKQWTDAVHVVDGLRDRGHLLQLHIVGTPEDGAYEKRLRALAGDRPWMHLHVGLARHAMMSLVARQRYGLHVQQGEHFGIAVAELVRAGCLTFVASPGGPTEIVGDDQAVIFATPDEGIERMARLLDDPRARDEARRRMAARREVFTEERFMLEMRHVVQLVLEGERRA